MHNKLLILDNYDSFTYNLVHLIEKVSNIEFDVVRNNEISLAEIDKYSHILLSPGPGLPKDAGIMPELLKKHKSTKSILGVCLGMQAIAEEFGGTLENLPTVCHGQATPIKVSKSHYLFNDCTDEFLVGRYHSWVVSKHNFPDELEATAFDKAENMMALKHKTLNISAVQFHPESILSEFGEQIIKNWLSRK